MNDDQILKEPNKQVFFITSHQSKLDKSIEYDSKLKNIQLKKILTEFTKYKGEDFTINVFSFEIINEVLRIKNKDSMKYRGEIRLKYRKTLFPGLIELNENKNNFIYDFQFGEYRGWYGNISPPISIKFSKGEQLKIYNNALKQLNVKHDEQLFLDLIYDSKLFLNNTKYYFDFYLELFKSCYLLKDIKDLIIKFELKNVLLPKGDLKEYSNLLYLIEKQPDILIKYCSENEKKDTFYKKFYTILLFFTSNYDKDQIHVLLQKEEVLKYFIDIFLENHEYFPGVSKSMIIDIMKNKSISFDFINKILSFTDSLEERLSIINNNIEIISECCFKENKVFKKI